MSDNFKTCGEAWRYCEKYGLNNITAGHSFQIAAALLRAYQDGAKEHSTAPDSEGDATCTCNGLPHMPTCPFMELIFAAGDYCRLVAKEIYDKSQM